MDSCRRRAVAWERLRTREIGGSASEARRLFEYDTPEDRPATPPDCARKSHIAIRETRSTRKSEPPERLPAKRGEVPKVDFLDPAIEPPPVPHPAAASPATSGMRKPPARMMKAEQSGGGIGPLFRNDRPFVAADFHRQTSAILVHDRSGPIDLSRKLSCSAKTVEPALPFPQ